MDRVHVGVHGPGPQRIVANSRERRACYSSVGRELHRHPRSHGFESVAATKNFEV